MLTAISGTPHSPLTPAATPAPQAPVAASTQTRATAQDTVTISAGGRQAASAATDMDHDGDSR